jgi:hypothetical protein
MVNTPTEITRCEVCGKSGLPSVLDLGSHPLCDDLVPLGEDRSCKQYPIEILFCDVCRTAYQRFQVPKRELFPSTYHYRSRHTLDVLAGMQDLVAATVDTIGDLGGKMVFDIGCNDGSLLSFFREKGAITFGIEPTGAFEDARAQGHQVVHAFFDEDVATGFVERYGQPDVITLTNVFAHIEDLQQVLRALQIVSRSSTVIVIENHYLGAVLAKNQFDTFYHEHPRTYSYSSFVFIADALGMEIRRAEFPKRYGGNIRVILGALEAGAPRHSGFDAIHREEEAYGKDLSRLTQQMERWRAKKGAELREELRRAGKLPAKAFPGRAAILIKLLGLDEGVISAVYEKSASAKVGHYLPGTRIPIRSDDAFPFAALGEAPLLNLAWHISGEIKAYMRERGYSGRIIDILSPEDFSE